MEFFWYLGGGAAEIYGNREIIRHRFRSAKDWPDFFLTVSLQRQCQLQTTTTWGGGGGWWRWWQLLLFDERLMSINRNAQDQRSNECRWTTKSEWSDLARCGLTSCRHWFVGIQQPQDTHKLIYLLTICERTTLPRIPFSSNHPAIQGMLLINQCALKI